MDEMEAKDLVMTDEERERKLALLKFVFGIGPSDMFPSTAPPPVPRKCKQCGAIRRPYRDCEECGAKWPT